ncbi:hypothetical protein G5B38_11900 [Pseudohalocynthiibacter aestuariivivens]|nr:hypothetical protein [Pseudohalocynthiibacter aestuariivivens]QIE46170.1 hypothetical protein G5B38_11900 [Pseudohalocynthiibacter aestuariivivens]
MTFLKIAIFLLLTLTTSAAISQSRDPKCQRYINDAIRTNEASEIYDRQLRNALSDNESAMMGDPEKSLESYCTAWSNVHRSIVRALNGYDAELGAYRNLKKTCFRTDDLRVARERIVAIEQRKETINSLFSASLKRIANEPCSLF